MASQISISMRRIGEVDQDPLYVRADGKDARYQLCCVEVHKVVLHPSGSAVTCECDIEKKSCHVERIEEISI